LGAQDAGDALEWQRIDWDSAEEHPMIAGGMMLVVRGVSEVPMKVEIHPQTPGIAPEDYGHNTVVGKVTEPVTQVRTEWTAEINTDSLTRGRKGYMLLSATKRQFFPPKDE
jgi:hypothetical protein